MAKKVSTSWLIIDNIFCGDENSNPEGFTIKKVVGQQYAVSADQAISRFKYKTGFIEGDRGFLTRWEEHLLTAVRESDWRKEND